MLIAVIVFLLPQFIENQGDLTIRLTAAILFIIGPLEMLVQAIPVFTRANVAVDNIYELERQLDKVSNSYDSDTLSRAPKRKKESFETIGFDNALFYYTDIDGSPLFTVGLLNLTIQRGEILFIVGGNGSGKSTFLKLFTGLYYPVSGRLRMDGAYLSRSVYDTYRELFSIIFTDFHLFNRLYGLEAIESEKINELLALMQLEKKTEVIDGLITNIDLSHSLSEPVHMSMVLKVLKHLPRVKKQSSCLPCSINRNLRCLLKNLKKDMAWHRIVMQPRDTMP